MLETARLDKQRFELNYEDFDLVSIVRSNVELMQKTVNTEGKPTEYDIDFIEPKFKEFIVNADRTRINQAVYALLSNATKYYDPEKKKSIVKVSLSKQGNSAIISFKDNGIGIAQEDINKLGKKFMRLNPKTNGGLQRPGGTGLGLYVVKGIMKFHGGELIINSEGLGKGSTFTMQFPIHKSNNG